MIEVGRLITELPLFIALLILARRGNKTFKVKPLGAAERDDLRVIGKAIVYVFVAGILLWFVAPKHFGILATIFGFILTTIVATLSVLAAGIHNLPTHLDALAWRDGWKDPWRRGTINPTPYIRWARRFAMSLFVAFVAVFALIAALIGGAQGSTISAQGGSGVSTTAPASAPATPASAPATAATQQETPTAPATSAPSTSAPTPVDNSCYTSDGQNGPQQIPGAPPRTIPFGTGNLKVCNSGTWRNWTDITTIDPPQNMQLVAYQVDGSYAYMALIDTRTGDQYVIRTTDFRS